MYLDQQPYIMLDLKSGKKKTEHLRKNKHVRGHFLSVHFSIHHLLHQRKYKVLSGVPKRETSVVELEPDIFHNARILLFSLLSAKNRVWILVENRCGENQFDKSDKRINVSQIFDNGRHVGVDGEVQSGIQFS